MNLDRETLKKLIQESINEMSVTEGVADDLTAAVDSAKVSGAAKQAVTGLAKLQQRLKSAFAGVEKLQMQDKAKLAEFFVSNLLKTNATEISSYMKKVQSDKEAAAEREERENQKNPNPEQGGIQ